MTDIRTRCRRGTCGCNEACEAMEYAAESRRDRDDERDPFGTQADRASDRTERNQR